MKILAKLKNLQTDLTTYGLGLLQAKAYRILNFQTAEHLKEHAISPIEWALLGLLYENRSGLQSTQAAKELGVEAPFVTAMGDHLEKLGLISKKNDGQDKRIKVLSLTAAGKIFVPKIEKMLRQKMRFLLHGASVRDMLTYRKLLRTIVENSEKPK